VVCELNTFGLSVSRLQHPVPSGIPAHRKIGRAPGSSQAGGRETGSELESGIDGCCWPAVEATAADAVRTAVVTRNYVSTLGGNFQTAGMKFHQTLKNEPWGRGISSSKTLTVISYCSRDRPTFDLLFDDHGRLSATVLGPLGVILDRTRSSCAADYFRS
jgi:hypothetical protein